MADLGAQLAQLSPEQRQAIMMQAQQEANQTVMQEMMKGMITSCFDTCAGSSVRGTAIALVIRSSNGTNRAKNWTAVNNLVWELVRIGTWRLERKFKKHYRSDREECNSTKQTVRRST